MTTTDEIKSRIDIVSYIERHVSLKRAGRIYKACCPFHKDRTPSFVVDPQKQTWRCYGACNDGGDVFSFHQKYHHTDFKDSLKALAQETNTEIKAYQPPATKKKTPDFAYHQSQPTASETALWQERAHQYLDYVEDMMWSDDSVGRDYLYQRGFTEDTIILYRLGYCPQDFWDDWGLDKKVWLPKGIVIPYEVGEYARLTKIRIRRLDWQRGDEYGKYISPAGVQNTAYQTRRILPGDIVVMTEGELDACILKQAVPIPRVVALATGSTGGARQLQYMAQLALADQVLVAFDADTAGEQVSRYWLDALNNAIRKVPTQHDINDMYLAGDDIYQWVYGGE